MAGTLTISGLSSSEMAGERVFGPLTIVGSIVIGETLAVPLNQGDNTFAVPVGSTAVMILGPTNGTTTLTLRTALNSSDTGLPINGSGYPLVYPFPVSSVPTTLIINSSAALSSPTSIVFI